MTTKSLFTFGAPVLNIIDDYLASDDDVSRPFYVTPIMRRGNLRQWLNREFPSGPSEDWALDFFKMCCDGLEQIHSSGVAHRDVKPENILIDDKGAPVFCDLGLCLPLNEDLGTRVTTQDLERIGSLHYTPREGYGGVRRSGEVQFAFDVFASGKILYELLSGRVLPGLESHRTPEYDLVRSRGGSFYGAVNLLLDGMLHEQPEVRLKTWKTITLEVDALNSALHPDPPETQENMIRDRLAVVTGKIQKTASPAVPTTAYSQEEARGRTSALVEKIVRVWTDDSEVAVVLDEWLNERGDVAVKESRMENSIFSSVFEAPYVQSYRGLDPLRRAGWSRDRESRQEAILGLKASTDRGLRSLWMGSTVFPDGDSVVVLFFLVEKEPGEDGHIDIQGGVKSVEGEFYGVSLEEKVERAAIELARGWVGLALEAIEEMAK